MAFINPNSRWEAANLQNLDLSLTIRYLDCVISTRLAPQFRPESFVNWDWFIFGVSVYIVGIYWYIFGIYFVYIFGITWFKLAESQVCIWLVSSTSLVVQTQLSILEWAQGRRSPLLFLKSFIHQAKVISENGRWDHHYTYRKPNQARVCSWAEFCWLAVSFCAQNTPIPFPRDN